MSDSTEPKQPEIVAYEANGAAYGVKNPDTGEIDVFHKGFCSNNILDEPRCNCGAVVLDHFSGYFPDELIGKDASEFPENTRLRDLEGMCGCNETAAFDFDNSSGSPIFTKKDLLKQPPKFSGLPKNR